ncbi:hypothetical protein F5Y03DRAFT_374446 [Xylaria venustula]|nr:hypothetical protein F5Y03DRAFT_374446 [Xylaria venustula]
MSLFGQFWHQSESIVGVLRGNPTSSLAAALIIGVIFLLLLLTPDQPTIPGAPVHGRRWSWEPTFWLQSRFTFGASEIIRSGYAKVGINQLVESANL